MRMRMKPSLTRRFLSLHGMRRTLLLVIMFICIYSVSLAAERSPEPQQNEQQTPNADSLSKKDKPSAADSSDSSDSTPSAEETAREQDQHEPIVVFELSTSGYNGDVAWEQAMNSHLSSTNSDSKSEPSAQKSPTLAERQEFVERMQATLDTLLERFEEQGTQLMEGEHRTIKELKQLIEEAAPLMTTQLLQELPHVYEQFVDAQTIAEDLLDQSEPVDPVEAEPTRGLISDEQPSDAYLDLEDRVHAEGMSDEILVALEELARDQNDLFAHEALAFWGFFEPNATHNRDFSEPFAHLRVAADAGLGVASSLLAMLSLVDFGVPRNKSLPLEDRRQLAEDLLQDLAREQDFTASLVVGYRMYTGEMTGLWKSDTCMNAVRYYHRCAESNVHQIADMGGERAHDLVRLSEEFVAAGTVNEQLQDDALQRYEYFRSIAGNPMDEQWVEATERLGEMYFYGDDAAGVRQDYAQATEHFRRAAEAGEPLAQANYGMMLAQGIGAKQDNVTALKYFKMAAAQGSGFAMHGIGVLYLTGAGVPKNETKAVEYFMKAIELGYTEAHSYVGSAYLDGKGVERNESLAFAHFTEAATTQSSQALFNLGLMYYRGAGTNRSCPIAVEFFRRVATQPALLADLPFSMERAYDCYKKGDYIRAFLQYRLLSEFGSEEAQTNAAFMLEQFGDQIFENVPSGSGLETTPLWMGDAKRPLVEAMALYERAAALNDTEAIRKTGACHYDGWDEACEKNLTRAIEQFQKAAHLGDPEAAYNVGAMYSTGDGVPRDLDAAKRFFSMCSDAGFPESVPCALALSALTLAAAAKDLVDSVVAFAPSPLRSLLSL